MGTQGAMTHKFELAEIFVQCTYRQVSSSHVYSFGSYSVDTQTYKQTRQPTLICPTSHVVAQRHIFGGAHPGGYDPQIQTRQRFLYNTPTPKFHHPICWLVGSYCVDKQTNKQTDAAENIQCSSLRYDVV